MSLRHLAGELTSDKRLQYDQSELWDGLYRGPEAKRLHDEENQKGEFQNITGKS